ncbi:DUF3109 family protein [bacterium]|nr:DUF3109 family protein [bacterium]
MIIVEDCLLSEDIIEKTFSCNLSACKGACCVEGDTGAPLEEGEIEKIEAALPLIIEEMDEEGLKTIAHLGVSEIDVFDEPVTTCKPNKECAFAVRKAGILACAIELANRKHDFGFPKPISCHLYPIRAKKYNEYHALNYHKWDICSAACDKGEKEEIRVFEFCESALKRKFGSTWYDKLKETVELHGSSD